MWGDSEATDCRASVARRYDKLVDDEFYEKPLAHQHCFVDGAVSKRDSITVAVL